MNLIDLIIIITVVALAINIIYKRLFKKNSCDGACSSCSKKKK